MADIPGINLPIKLNLYNNVILIRGTRTIQGLEFDTVADDSATGLAGFTLVTFKKVFTCLFRGKQTLNVRSNNLGQGVTTQFRNSKAQRMPFGQVFCDILVSFFSISVKGFEDNIT